MLTCACVRVGTNCCVVPTCADDVAIASDDESVLQSLVNIAVDFSEMELFLLQPVNSVVLEVPNNAGKQRRPGGTEQCR